MIHKVIATLIGLIGTCLLAINMPSYAQGIQPVMMQPCADHDRFVCPRPTRRTFVIFAVNQTPHPTEHMAEGDFFRIFKTGPMYKVQALDNLAKPENWGPAPINMEAKPGNLDVALCAIVNMQDNGVPKPHKLWIEIKDGPIDDTVDIAIRDDDLDCSQPPIGGGGARAMN